MRKNRPKNRKKKTANGLFFVFFEKKSTKRLPVQKIVVPLHSEINNGFPFLLTPWLSW